MITLFPSIGYFISWTAQLPTGATMVAAAGLLLLPGFVLTRRGLS